MWSKGHFDATAKLLSEASYLEDHHREWLAVEFGKLFAADNARFKPGLYLDAALGAGNYSSRSLNSLRSVQREGR